MLVHFLVFLCLFLTVWVAYFMTVKVRDRAIKEGLRQDLEIEKRQKEASLEFNAYFLNNYGSIDGITIWLNSKYYILYNNSGQAIIKERSEKFSIPEKLFYGLNDRGIQH